ncbi:MAG: lysozyme [Henriciella sp.]
MASELRTSEAGLKLIMAYEGFRPVSKQLPDGRWVIGYGHLKAARANQKVSQQEAAAILREYDLPPIEKALQDLVLVPMSQSEFDALMSFAFNIGIEQFEDSEVLAHLNSGDRLKAATAMESWRKARVGAREMVVDPLVRRRADEKALFLKTSGAVPLAASSRFRPLADVEAAVPQIRPRSIEPISDWSSRSERPGHRDDEIAPETAARTVRERLTRILGEEDLAPAPADLDDEQDEHETSVEEIRAAISALVSDDDAAPAPKPQAGDIELEEIILDDPDDSLAALETDGMVNGDASNRRGKLLIDDVTPAEIDPELARRAGMEPQLREGPVEIFLFGLLALFGAAFFAFGGAAQFGWFGAEADKYDGALAYMPPFIMLAGGLLFLIMAYYCVRAVFAPRD